MSAKVVPASMMALISALVAWPSLNQVRSAAPAPVAEVWFHLAAYRVPAERSFSLSATNMMRATLVPSSPIKAVLLSAITMDISQVPRPIA
jgi:hypothetical protein